MQTNLALHPPLFAGAVSANGVPVNLEGSTRMLQSKGGIISLNNVVTGVNPAYAYFGSVMTVNSAGGDSAAFYVGDPTSGTYVVSGILLNEQGIRENDPAKPNYIMNEMNCTVVTRGRLWFATWALDHAGAIAPVPGCLVVWRYVSAGAVNVAGQIGFVAAGGAIPAGHAQLQAAVVSVITGIGADIDFFIPVAAAHA